MRRAVGLVALTLCLAAPIGVRGEPVEARFADAVVQDASPARPHARERLREIRRRIQAALRYPPMARERDVSGTPWVRFELGHDGQPLDIEISRSSGSRTLDRAARAAVEDAAPLPWVYGRLEVPVAFELEARR